MAKNPSYVRLAERYSHGVVADITEYRTGWSISGNDVKPFPEDEDFPNEAAFVADLVRRGVLEPASKAEYDELQEAAQALRDAHVAQVVGQQASDLAELQEHGIQAIVDRTQRKIAKRRANKGQDEEVEEEAAGERQSDTGQGAANVPAGGGKK